MEDDIDILVREEANRLVEEYLRFLLVSVRQLVHERMGGKAAPNSEETYIVFNGLLEIFKGMRAKINKEKQFLFHMTVAKIAEYASEFDVDATKLDAYKFFYWFCEVCLELFPTGTESQLARLAMIHGMNELLQTDVGKGLSPIMAKKIKKTLLAGKLRENFGKFGLYKLYKNCSRICRDTCPNFKESDIQPQA